MKNNKKTTIKILKPDDRKKHTHTKIHTHSRHLNIKQYGGTIQNSVQESMLLFIKGRKNPGGSRKRIVVLCVLRPDN